MRYPGRENPSHLFLSFVNPVVTIMSSRQTFLWSPIDSFRYTLQTLSSLFLKYLPSTPRLHLIPWLSFSAKFFPFSSTHIKTLDRDHWNIPGQLVQNTCVCMRAGSVCFYLLMRCDMYMDSWVTTEKMYSDPHTKPLPHSLSRFHILSHIRGMNKRGSVCLAVA